MRRTPSMPVGFADSVTQMAASSSSCAGAVSLEARLKDMQTNLGGIQKRIHTVRNTPCRRQLLPK